MKAIVTIGSFNCATVLPNATLRMVGLAPAATIGINARNVAISTSVPAAARKSRRYVSGYGVVWATTGASRCTSATGLPSTIWYAPGQLKSQTGKRKDCGACAAGGPIHGSGQ